MKYNLEINGETTALSIAEHEDGHLHVMADGREYRLASQRIDAHHLTLVVDGVRVNAFVSGEDDARQVMINGVTYEVHDADRQALTAAAGGSDRERPREVTPPMPSVVVAILVEEGQAVVQGDNLVVVSAMKMETTLTAPFDARVVGINVAAGDKVKPGDILVDLETVSLK
jgi:acetyl/propionyl-CoA carboxylase alpha subunit